MAPTKLKVGMEINTGAFPKYKNRLQVVSVEGDIAKIKVVKLEDFHAQGKDSRPRGYFSSYWEEGKVYTLHRFKNFPEMDYWCFDQDELKRHTSILTILLEEIEGVLNIIVDMDT